MERRLPGLGERDGELLLNGCRVSVLQDEKPSGYCLHNSVNVPTLLNCTWKNGCNSIS